MAGKVVADFSPTSVIPSGCKHRSHSPLQLSRIEILVAGSTERHVVGLILYQQIGLSRGMRLVTRQTIYWSHYLARSRGIHQIRNRVTIHRVSHAKFQGQRYNSVLREVVFGKFHASVEDCNQVLGLQFFRIPLWPMAFEAEGVRSTGAQQVVIVPAVWSVAGGASLLECRLVAIWFLACVRDIAVAAQADIDGIRLRKSWLTAGVRAVTIRAIAGGAGMLNLCGVDQLSLIVMAGYAQSLGIGLRENDFPVLGRSVADLALLVGERWVGKLGHQLGSSGLVRIVAAYAVRSLEGLVLVRLLQVSILHIMAVDAEGRGRLGQVIVELYLAYLAGFVRGVARVAAHIEGSMAAAFLGNIQAGIVAAQAEIFFLIS